MSGEKLKELLKQASSTEGINRENIIDILKEILAKKYPHAHEEWKKSEYGELSVNHLLDFFQNWKREKISIKSYV